VAERDLAASGKRVSEARKAMLPRISLTGSFGYSSSQLENLLSESFSVWSLAANAVQPIFQGLRLSAAVERARAVAQERLAVYGQTALDAFREVETALAAERFLDQSVVNLDESATQSSGDWRISSRCSIRSAGHSKPGRRSSLHTRTAWSTG